MKTNEDIAVFYKNSRYTILNIDISRWNTQSAVDKQSITEHTKKI
jgi:hypothetical protein